MRILLALLAGTMIAADWPQFLGPKRDSSTAEKVAAWKDEPALLWNQPVGEAHSSPVIANGMVYAFFRKPGKDDENDLEILAAFDAKTGDKKWEQSTTRKIYKSPFGNGPQSTPTVDGGKVFTFGNSGILTARDAKSGEKLWSNATLTDFNAKNLFFGVATSPIVVNQKVIVMVGGKGAGIVAFNVDDGKVAWKTSDDPASYSSPVSYGEKSDLAFLTGSHLRGISADGKELWSFPFKDRLNESSTMPLSTSEGMLGSSVTAGSVLLKISGDKAEKVWEKKNLTCYFSTPVLIGKHIYMINGAATLTNASVTLRCVELATGKVAWEKPKVGRYHAALVRTGDDKLLMLDDNGYLTLFESDTKEYKELARSKVCGLTWAHPALVDGKLYLRDEKNLICLDMK